MIPRSAIIVAPTLAKAVTISVASHARRWVKSAPFENPAT